jgi:triphosphoribosyl-dephospho-CoA synthase
MRDVATAVCTACVWEATARKAGNVHPGASFSDLTHADFVRSGEAIAPELARLVAEPLGATVLKAIRATRAVVATNTNLGIVLLLAPLSKCDPGSPDSWQRQLRSILDTTTVADAAAVYEAIRRAVPGGLGKVNEQDVAEAPTQTLLEVMALAAGRDLIARQYTNAFADVLEVGVPALLRGLERFGFVEAAVQSCQLHLLASFPDSLIARKRGEAEAIEVSRRAAAIDLAAPDGPLRYAQFDTWLRVEGNSRNPGTTADLVTACLFVALREDRMTLDTPFSRLEP